MKDLAKRKRVMARSMQLGHCICDPKKPCPCDIFKEKDICPCAGERVPAESGPVRLTEMVDSPGCASKIDQASLRKVLEGLPAPSDPRVLVGMAAGDDAGVYQLDEHTALVQTVDVFAPSVDDPYTFGQIAAANSLSDVYAMGARPISALSIVGFPIRTVDDSVMHEILRGGIDKMTEAETAVIGGHSINDAQIKAGFAVTGLLDPTRAVTNAAAQPGDRLVLTKPIGTGVVAFAAQIGRADADWLAASARAMATLNRRASELMVELRAHACTDVTGFGLMGHLGAMAAASGVDVEVVWDDLPLLPGVLQCLADGVIPGAVERNRESSADCAVADEAIDRAMLDICFDAQTSGGLLVAIAEDQADEFLRRLHADGASEAASIGRVVGPGTGRVLVRTTGSRQLPPAQAENTETDKDLENAEGDMSCCGDEHGPGGAADTEARFKQFQQAAGAPGALDAHTKQAVAIALSVLAKCEPCVVHHVKKAREMGFSQEQIDEAAWMAVSFGGCPTMMFYNKYGKR